MAAQPIGINRSVSSGQIRLMTKIAHLYHEQNLRQSEIAALLHISQAKVSRLLKRAGEVGIVRTVVVVSQGVHTDLEQALEERYGLLEAIVADIDGDEAAVIAGLGSSGATYLEATLSGGERIGVSSWSQTLLSVADRLAPLRTSGADQVVQLVGGLGVASAQAQANRLLSELASLVGAAPTFVPAPGLVGDHLVRESLLGDPAMQTVAADWENLTMALVGIGSLQPSQLLRASGNAIAADDQIDPTRARGGRRCLQPLLRHRRPARPQRPRLSGHRHRPGHLPCHPPPHRTGRRSPQARRRPRRPHRQVGERLGHRPLHRPRPARLTHPNNRPSFDFTTTQ